MSQYKQIPIADATAAQLREFASSHLGIEVHPNSNREAVLAKLSAASYQFDYIEVPESTAPADMSGGAPRPQTAEHQAKAHPKPGKVRKIRLMIARTDEPGGDRAVPVAVNGRAMLVPRGEECDVPEPYVEVLKKAIRYVYDPLPDGKGINPVPRKVPRFPMQIFGPVA